MAVIKIEAKKDTRCMQTICLIRGDRRTQILRFGVNRFDGGVDLSDLAWVIKTANAKGVEDVFEPEAVEIGENRITVDWLVDGSVTDADGMAKYELNGLDATEDGKGIVWKGGMGTMSLRADIGENFADIDMTNIDRLVLYVEGRLQHIIDLTDELQNAGETANAAATAANAGAARAESAAIAANTGATAATEAASNASAAAEAANTAALPHAQLYGMRVRGETAKASDNPVSFLPDAGSLLQPVTVLEPQQQGSGDPYPAGGGKNLLNYDIWKTTYVEKGTAVWENYGVTLTATGNDCFTDYGDRFPEDAKIPVNEGDTITLSWETDSADGTGSAYIFPNGGTNGMAAEYNISNNKLTYTAGAGVTFVKFRFGVSSAGDTISYKNIQIEKGSEATDFQPYSNIRPFVGYDKLDLNHAGKNLFTGWIRGEKIASSNGAFMSDTTGARTDYIPVLSSKQMEISGLTATLFSFVAFYDSAKNFITRTNADDAVKVTVNVPENCRYIAITQYENVSVSGVISDLKDTVQVNFGTSSMEYTPSAGLSHHTVQIGQTVYGGRFDWLTGKGVIEWRGKKFDGTENWGIQTNANGLVRFWLHDDNIDVGYNENILNTKMCSHAKETLNASSTYGASNLFAIYAAKDIYINLGFNNLDDFKAFLAAQNAAGTPVQIAYKLATPIEIQLTPHVLTAVEPEQNNTLYGDGTIEVEYVKPLHVSIEERVAAALAAAAQTE